MHLAHTCPMSQSIELIKLRFYLNIVPQQLGYCTQIKSTGHYALIDNLQNYCLGTRYGARSRSRLCRRVSISLVHYRHGLEKFLEHHFIPIRRRFNPHDLPKDLLRVQDPFFRGRRPIFSTGNDGAWPAVGTPSLTWHVLFLCGRSSHILSLSASFFL